MMKNTFITILRNEHDVIETFVGHICALVDEVIFVDHQSIDGTREYLHELAESMPSVRVIDYDEPGYFQPEILNLVVRDCLARDMSRNGWFIFGDVDEFFNLSGKDELSHLLFNRRRWTPQRFDRYNCVPGRYEAQFNINETHYVTKEPLRTGKLAVSKLMLAKNPEFYISTGGHFVYRAKPHHLTAGDKLQDEHAGDMYHFPLRGAGHVMMKVAQSSAVYRLKDGYRTRSGGNYHRMHKYLESRGHDLTEEEVNVLAANYAGFGMAFNSKKLEERTVEEMVDNGEVVRQDFDLAMTEVPPIGPPKHDYWELAARSNEEIRTRPTATGYETPPDLVLWWNRIISRDKVRDTKEFQNMQVVTILGAPRSGTSMLTEMLAKSGIYAGPLERLIPSSEVENPRGYWEYQPFWAINKGLQRILPDSMPKIFAPFQKNWSKTYDTRQFVRQAIEHVIEDFNGHDVWVWKDPLTRATYEFWQDLFPGIKPIVLVRHPMESASSLAAGYKGRRGTMAQGLANWQGGYEVILRTMEPDEAIWIHYNQLLEQPRETLKRVFDGLGLPYTDNQFDIAASLVSSDRRRHEFALAEIPTDLREAYMTYCGYAGSAPPPDPPQVDTVEHLITLADKRALRLEEGLQKEISEIRSRKKQVEQTAKRVKTENKRLRERLTSLRGANGGGRSARALGTPQAMIASAQAAAMVARLEQRVHLIEAQQRRRVGVRVVSGGYNRLLWMRYAVMMRTGRLQEPPEFDKAWYLRQYLKGAPGRFQRNPYLHYLVYGWHIGYCPSPAFDPIAYLQANPDVMASGMEPLRHYTKFGKHEGRKLHPQY